MKNKSIKDFNVLIVEDNVVNSTLLTLYLKKVVSKISVATDGQEAVDLTRNNNYDLILMDIKLPVLSGREATKQIKLINPNILIIAQSATPRNIDGELNDVFDDYLTKPFTKEDVVRVLADYGTL